MGNVGIVVILWDEVALDAAGNLVSRASFTYVLEGLRQQTKILLLCAGTGTPQETDGIRVVPLGITPTFELFLRRPFSYVRHIRRGLSAECRELDPNVPVLLVDAVLANYFAARELSAKSLFLYIRGDDVLEAKRRARGIKWIGGIVHGALLAILRRFLIVSLPVVGAGARPLPERLLRHTSVIPFYPSSLSSVNMAKISNSPLINDKAGQPNRIVWIGRMTRIKRVDRLISAAALFAKSENRSVELDLIGDGPERERLQRLAEGIESPLKTIFHGRLPQCKVLQRLSGSLCLAITSEWEGFPKVIPEALCVGVPIVAPDVGSVSALITQRKVGIVVSGSDKALCDAFALLSRTPEIRQAFSVNARRAVKDLALDEQCGRLLAKLTQSDHPDS